ncbi:MAG: hypothetical protein AAFN10_16810 [Bacteroidota bacterium]
MRYLVILLCTLAFSTVSAQNSAFLDFGQSAQKVSDNLGHYERPLGELKSSPNLLTYQFSKTRWLDYHFLGDELYRIEDIQVFADKDKAKEMIEACKVYLSLGAKDPVELNAPLGTSHYAKVFKDRVVELVVFNDRKNNLTQITLRVTSRNFGPRMEAEALAMKVADQ